MAVDAIKHWILNLEVTLDHVKRIYSTVLTMYACLYACLKLRSHMHGAVAERRRQILTFPLRHRGYVHTYAGRTRTDLPFPEDKDGSERTVSKRVRKIGCWTHLLRSGFCSRTAIAHVWTHAMIWVEANFPPDLRSAHVWTYLKRMRYIFPEFTVGSVVSPVKPTHKRFVALCLTVVISMG